MSEKIKEGSDKIKEAQSYIGGMTVAEFQHRFRMEFRDIYSTRAIQDLAICVGPMQSFLGFLIKEGVIELKVESKDK